MKIEPRYQHVSLPLSAVDGNPLAVIAAVRTVLQRAGVSADEIRTFSEEALSGDYDRVLQTTAGWVRLTD